MLLNIPKQVNYEIGIVMKNNGYNIKILQTHITAISDRSNVKVDMLVLLKKPEQLPTPHVQSILKTYWQCIPYMDEVKNIYQNEY
jgi:hypothetical protein